MSALVLFVEGYDITKCEKILVKWILFSCQDLNDDHILSGV